MLQNILHMTIHMNLSINIGLIFTLFVWLMAILNPVSTIPYYMILNPDSTDSQIKHDAKVISFGVFMVLLFAATVGIYILNLFGLDIIYFKIAWWIILSYMAFSMVKWDVSKVKSDINIWKKDENNVYLTRWLIIPLAMPLTSWPWTIAYVIWISHWWFSQYIALVWAIIIAAISTFFILRYWLKIKNIIGDLWIRLITRFMWLILLWLWIQVIVTNFLSVIK